MITFLNSLIHRYNIFVIQLFAFQINIHLIYKLLNIFYNLKQLS